MPPINRINLLIVKNILKIWLASRPQRQSQEKTFQLYHKSHYLIIDHNRILRKQTIIVK